MVKFMKTVCPTCNVEGFLEVRGNSKRIKHYVGVKDGIRKYDCHKVSPKLGVEGSNPSSSATVPSTNKLNLSVCTSTNLCKKELIG